VGLVEIDKHACATLRLNRPHWNVLQRDLNEFDGSAFKAVGLITGGSPRPVPPVSEQRRGQDLR
jgi:DNA (cytosine-5)-methyltransferase 1